MYKIKGVMYYEKVYRYYVNLRSIGNVKLYGSFCGGIDGYSTGAAEIFGNGKR